jgi:hypothetical protein
MFHKVLQVGRYRLRAHRTETCSDHRVASTEQESLRLFHETASLEEISNRICDSREIEMNTRFAKPAIHAISIREEEEQESIRTKNQ